MKNATDDPTALVKKLNGLWNDLVQKLDGMGCYVEVIAETTFGFQLGWVRLDRVWTVCTRNAPKAPSSTTEQWKPLVYSENVERQIDAAHYISDLTSRMAGSANGLKQKIYGAIALLEEHLTV